VAPLYVASAYQEAPGISTISHCATSEVLTAALMKIPVCWGVMLFRLINIITGALKDKRAFIFWVKQGEAVQKTSLTSLFFNRFPKVSTSLQLISPVFDVSLVYAYLLIS